MIGVNPMPGTSTITTVVAARISPQQARELRQVATRDGLTVSQKIARIVTEAIAAEKTRGAEPCPR
jgi:hypothetical protein